VGAVGADGKEFITAANQNQFFAVCLARYHAPVAQIANWKSISEIGFVRLWCLCHDLPPEPISILHRLRCRLPSNRWFRPYYSANCAGFSVVRSFSLSQKSCAVARMTISSISTSAGYLAA
jgi:hypothetical protein